MKADKINVDPYDLDSMIELMDEFGDSQQSFFGENEDGESIRISIAEDSIVVSTNQDNGWVRVNTYWRDGTQEETFDGRWK